jgi:ComF family protein
MINDFISLFYPSVCAACGNSLYKHEKAICNKCYVNIPKTNFLNEKEHALYQKFYGRFLFNDVTAFYQFKKGNRTQKLMHALKYKGNSDVGIVTGTWFGNELIKHKNYLDADIIIPVPLHPKKLQKRGYNQSSMIAKGLSVSMNIPYREDVLVRNTFTNTQTKKDSFDRWQNVEAIFDLKNAEAIENKKIILVDDVITTGSTIEACVAKLKHVNVTINIASLAFAQI